MPYPISFIRGFSTSFAVVRMPILPFNQLFEWYNRPVTENEKLALIQHFAHSPQLQEAIFIASQDLYQELKKFNSQDTHSKERINKVYFALMKYFIRMSSRSVPFGLFAAFSPIEWKDETFANSNTDTAITLTLQKEMFINRRIDKGLLFHFYAFLIQLPAFRKQLRYFPNSTLYKLHDKWKYIKMFFIKDDIQYNYLSLQHSQILSEIVTHARQGAPYSILLDLITGMGYNSETAAQFTNQLIDSQFIVSDLYPNITGPDYQERFFMRLQELLKNVPRDDLSEALQQFIHEAEWLKDGSSFTIGVYESIIAIIHNIFDYPGRHYFQIDTLKSISDFRINTHSFVHLEKALQLLQALTPPLPLDRLEGFKKRLSEQFGERMVPLKLVFDPATGIPYESLPANEAGRSWTSTAQQKLVLYKEALLKGHGHIDLAELQPAIKPGSLPNSFYVLGSLLKHPSYAFSLQLYGGPSCSNLLTRFSHSDAILAGKIAELADKEAALFPDKLVAEIAHQPQARVGNILSRTNLREFEIVYLTQSMKPWDQQLYLEDLYVQVTNNRIVLYSGKHQKIVIPRLSSAHAFNHSSNLPLYQFLCELQLQDEIDYVIFWDWEFLSNEPFLPRIVYRNIVLCPATWNIYSKDLLSAASMNEAAGIEFFTEIKNRFHLPDLFYLTERDNYLFIDGRTMTGWCLLLQQAEKIPVLKLQECLFNGSDEVVKNEEGSFANEIIIPFIKEKTSADDRAVLPAAPSASAKTQRKYALGDNWIYAKIYGNPISTESELRRKLYPFLTTLLNKSIITKWFYIRYADPYPHIRVRLFVSNKGNEVEIVSELNRTVEKAMANDTLWKISYETYEPEIEKYGGTQRLMTLNEELFYRNSELVIQLTNLLIDESEQNALKKSIAVYYTHQLLCSLLKLRDIHRQIEVPCLESFKKEFQVEHNKALQSTLSQGFREQLPLLDFLLKIKTTTSIHAEILEQAKYVADQSIQQQQRELLAIKRALRNNRDRLVNIAINQVHVFMNRFFLADPRMEELFLYYNYHCLLRSLTARKLIETEY